MPNIPETVVAMLASIGLGAVWSNAAPEFGAQSIIDRFGQVQPRVLFVADGYRYGGKDFDRREMIARVVEGLPSVEVVVWLAYLAPSAPCPDGFRPYHALLDGTDPGAAFRFERVDAQHPLWVVFSSGTSGPPKAIVHSHVGGLLGMRNFSHFHMDVQPEDTVFFYTTTGWIMFNFMVSLLMNGATAVLYDGDPLSPDETLLWQLAVKTGATQLGGSPTYVEMLRSRNIVPKQRFDLSRLKAYCMSGAPCQPETMAWCYDNLKQDLWVNNFSGGTEVAGPLVAGSPMLPVHAGEIQSRALGMAVEAFDEQGRAVTGSVGELVCTRPFPSMPLCFLNDPEDRRYKETYFERFPGAWCHGDLLKVNERGGCYIYGRADSTLNRRGIRIGTAEIYRAVENIDGIVDSMAVCINEGGISDVMVLFVVLKPGLALDAAMTTAIRESLKTKYSPRHVPDRIEQVPRIPYTLTGKKMEIPVRKILSGMPLERVASRDAVRDPEALDYFVAKRESWGKARGNAPGA
jgi:acetoacetyl-CoA synthetase